jgi:hypothetical protein
LEATAVSGVEEPKSLEVSNAWLEASMFAGLYLKVVDPPKDLSPAHHNLMMMARVQFATESSFERFQVIAESEDTDISKTLQAYVELHLFQVSAHLYWTTLYELSKYLGVQVLEQTTDSHRFVAEQTRVARNHIEHITERIGEGRKRGPIPLSAQDFRRAMGTYDASTVTFGAESFNLGAIYGAIKDSEST